jgi:hypothetical protein
MPVVRRARERSVVTPQTAVAFGSATPLVGWAKKDSNLRATDYEAPENPSMTLPRITEVGAVRALLECQRDLA